MSLSSCFASVGLNYTALKQSCASTPQSVDLLLLGSGWSSTFILPIASEAGISTASTTRAGANGTIAWEFDPKSDDSENFRVLPDAKTVLVIFPIYEPRGVERLVRGYLQSRVARRQHSAGYYADEPQAEKSLGSDLDTVDANFILLGSTGIYDNGPTFVPMGPSGFKLVLDAQYKRHHHDRKPKPESPWIDNASPYKPVPRALSEERLLALSKPQNAVRSRPISTTVLLLCGLWGHGRSMRNFISRLPANKEVFRNLGSVHMIHGRDVGRAVRSVHQDFAKANGRRWILTNLRVYDMWDLAARFGSAGLDGRDHPPTGPFPAIVQELMNSGEVGGIRVKALPRSTQELFDMTGSHSLDGREFWDTFGLTPDSPWIE